MKFVFFGGYAAKKNTAKTSNAEGMSGGDKRAKLHRGGINRKTQFYIG